MLNGRRLSVVSHATAETAKTVSPSRTHGEVAAAKANEPLVSAVRLTAVCIPCLSSNCPTAAEPTANSSSARLASDTLLLQDRPPRSRARLSSGSATFDKHGLLGMRRQTKDELVTEDGGPQPHEEAIDLPYHPQNSTVGFFVRLRPTVFGYQF